MLEAKKCSLISIKPIADLAQFDFGERSIRRVSENILFLFVGDRGRVSISGV